MVNDILELIKLAREMLEKKREFEKEYFQNYVEPAWQLFQRIHNDYKDSFLEYSDSVSESVIDIDTLVEKIKKDSIYSDDIRSELSSVVYVLSKSSLGKTKDPVIDFIKSISNYFEPISKNRLQIHKQKDGLMVLSYEPRNENRLLSHDEYFPKTIEGDKKTVGKLIAGDLTNLLDNSPQFSNRTRYGVIIRLTRNKNDFNRKELNNFFQIIIQELQDRHNRVSKNYYQVKYEFLSRI